MAGRVSTVVIAVILLWLLWGERIFWPYSQELPEGIVLVQSSEVFSSLASGQAIAMEGKVFPVNPEQSRESIWKDRFAYRRAISQKNEFGGLEEVVTHLVRPAIRFDWAGGSIVVPADSYKMASAPKAPDDSMLQTTEKNVGFHSGDAALAMGRKIGEASVLVSELAIGPLSAYVKTLQRENSFRAWIGHGLRVVVSLLVLSILVKTIRGSGSDDIELPPSTVDKPLT